MRNYHITTSYLRLATLALLIALHVSFSPCMAQAAEQPSDADITRAVEVDLVLKDFIDTSGVDVSTNGGVVTLSGEVDSLFGKYWTARLAASIRGVQAVVDDVTVVTAAQDNAALRKDVKDALSTDPATASYPIDVAASSGMVTLSGTVDSWTEKDLAEEVAMQVKGVTGIDNAIEVKTIVQPGDAEMEKEIRRRMELDPFIDSFYVHVAVRDGRAILSGRVGSLAEKQYAIAAAHVAGIGGVDAGELQIDLSLLDTSSKEKAASPPLDSDLTAAVADVLRYDPRVSSFKIAVSVTDGLATLQGTVNNLMAKRAAVQDALNTPGIWDVQGLVKVRPEKQPSGAELQHAVEKAIARDNLLDAKTITVRVKNHTVTLGGDLKSLWGKVHAGDVAARVPGVASVQNRIVVNDLRQWRTDRRIAVDVKNRLFWNVLVKPYRIQVAVNDGVVTLTGSVDNWSQLRSAVDSAFEGGATSVKTQLIVGSGPANDQLYRHPFVGFLKLF